MDESWRARRERASDVVRTVRGVDDPAAAIAAIEAAHGALGSLAVDFGYGDIWSRPAMGRRDRSMVAVAMLTAIGDERELTTHVGGGLNHGLSPAELREIMVQMAAYAGFPRAHAGMDVVKAVLEGRGVDEPVEPAEQKSDEQRRADGVDVLATLTGTPRRPPEQVVAGATANLGELAAITIDFAFGEVWSRPQLSRRDRSLVVISVLTVLARSPELRIHLRGAMNHGLTATELEEVMLMAAVYGGFPTAVEGMRALREVTAPANPPG